MTGIGYKKETYIFDFNSCMLDLSYVYNNNIRKTVKMRIEDQYQILDDFIISSLQSIDDEKDELYNEEYSMGIDLMINVYCLSDDIIDYVYNEYTSRIRNYVYGYGLKYDKYYKIIVSTYRGVARLHCLSHI